MDFKNALKSAQKRIWGEVTAGLKAAGKDATVSGDLIADKIVALKNTGIGKKAAVENPRLLDAIDAAADAYRGQKIDLLISEEILEQTNAILAAVNQRLQPYGATANPTLNQAIDNQIAIGFREGIEDTVTKATGKGVNALKKLYGSLKIIRTAVESRIPVAERLQLMSLQEQINYPQAAGALLRAASGDPSGLAQAGGILVSSKIIKGSQKSDDLVKVAFDKLAAEAKGRTLTPLTQRLLGITKEPPTRRIELKTKQLEQSESFKKAGAAESADLTSGAKKGTMEKTKTTNMDSLTQEAKKYKTADEFVKAQKPLYHGTDAKFEKFDISKSGEVQPADWGEGIYFTDNPAHAKNFAKMAGGDIVMERFSPNIKFADGSKLLKDKGFLDVLDDVMGFKTPTEYLKEKGFDGIKYKNPQGFTEYVVYDTSKISTKSQLTDIWNQANK